MGIGGLDSEFAAIFRRAFASRLFPPDVIARLGVQHVRGMLLFGPPGTGKTLIARQIGKMLGGREPKARRPSSSSSSSSLSSPPRVALTGARRAGGGRRRRW